jgi:plasmid stability protein
MGINLSIKDVPEDLAQRLRERAARNHRSLQGELMAIIEQAAVPAAAPLAATESEADYAVQSQTAGASPADPAAALLDDLDKIVAGSDWGVSRLLTRDQLHDRVLARESDLATREVELAAAKARLAHRSAHRDAS